MVGEGTCGVRLGEHVWLEGNPAGSSRLRRLVSQHQLERPTASYLRVRRTLSATFLCTAC
jgi:hypothetical protein